MDHTRISSSGKLQSSIALACSWLTQLLCRASKCIINLLPGKRKRYINYICISVDEQICFWMQRNDNTNRRVTSSRTNSRALAHADNECEFRSTWQSQTGNPPAIMCILGRTGHHIKLKQIRRDCDRTGTSWHEQKHIIKSHIRSRQIRPPTGDRTRHEPGTERHQNLTYIYMGGPICHCHARCTKGTELNLNTQQPPRWN